jgi:hypothetical protein
MSPETTVTEKADARLRESLDAKGKLPCPVAWQVASEFDLTVRAVGDWANENGIRLSSCALGCFE